MTYLDKIISHKREEVASMKLYYAERNRDVYDIHHSLQTKHIIAEVKKASPSLGDINTEVDVVKRALDYEKGGAGAVSVLTDEKYFKGSIHFLKDIADAVKIPVLCKDFIVDDIQIQNAYGAGADCILLIAAVLTKNELEGLSAKAKDLGMEILYEIHDAEEYKKIAELKPRLCGVNSRNLKTFEIDLHNAGTVISSLANESLIIAESGIENEQDLSYLKGCGADAFLIGTALMKADNPAIMLENFERILQ